jgi:hypothetical protein
MYVYDTENDPHAYDESVTVVLTRTEAARLAALLNEHELSGGKPPGSTLFTALYEVGVRPDVDAQRRARRMNPLSIVSDQWERYWETPTGQDHLQAFYRGERWN